MTTVFKEKKRCGVCGWAAEYTSIGSTNSFGSADLDTRPPEMERSTIFSWVQRCSACGYCSSDVGADQPGAKELIEHQAYRAQLSDPSGPELANSFLCAAMIKRAGKSYADATWSLIHAAWACDDSDHPERARDCRKKAAAMLLLARQHSESVGNPEEANTAILVDLLRRAGDFDGAIQALNASSREPKHDVISRVLHFEEKLLDKHDATCHTVAEALREM